MKARMLLSSVLAAGLLLTANVQARDHDNHRGHERQSERHRGDRDRHYHHDNYRSERREYRRDFRHHHRHYAPYYSVRPYRHWPHYYPHRSYYGYEYPYYGYRSGLDASVILTVPLY